MSDTVIYLHGFASSVQSSKATFLAGRLRARGLDVHVPDLNEPDFPTLTVTRMLDRVRTLMDTAAGPVTLIGSSLGAFVAIAAAVKWPDRVGRLVLLAPALDFAGPRMQQLAGITLESWKKAGQIFVFHFGYGRVMPVGFGLYEDARRYDALDAPLAMPILVFQGRRDSIVDPATVEQWSRRRPNVELHLLDDDHQLVASLPAIWSATSRFLGIQP